MSSPRVLIAGGGPVGLAVAALLAAQGVASTVIEADASYCTGSRAICLSRRSLEILDWAGAADAVAAMGLPWTSGRSYFRAQELLRFEMPHDEQQRFAPMTNIQQYYVEQYLLEAAQRNFPGLVQMRWNTRVDSVAQHGQGVQVRVSSEHDQEAVQADWLIACDGGRSTVREQLGLQLHGMQYEGRYVIVDVQQKSTRLQTEAVERLAWFDPPSNPGSTVLMHRQPGDVWRIDYQVRDDEDPNQAVKPENVLPRVKAHLEWIGEAEPWQPLWISIYNAKCLTLEKYRHGRVLFAGDAAHLVPIFGVRGLNSGLDDAGNLAWKLAAVMQGRAPESLLDSYSTERKTAALVNIEFGSKSTEFMSPPHHGFALLREAALRLAGSTPALRSLLNPRQSLPVRYPTQSADQRAASPGYVCPEVKQAQAYLSQHFGQGFVLLCFGQSLEVPQLKTVQLTSSVDVLSQARSRCEASADTTLLVRPDGYIAARWDELPTSAQVLAALKQAWAGESV